MELKEFQNKYPPEIEEKLIEYFSQNGGIGKDAINNTGLSELFADTYVLLHSYGHTKKEISHRILFATRYFPKTIAKIAETINNNLGL